MTKGVPADYFFEGDEHNASATLPLLAPLKINLEKAIKDGVSGKRPWEGSKCMLVAAKGATKNRLLLLLLSYPAIR